LVVGGSPNQEKPKSQPEKEFELEVYNTVSDFDEIVVQFGYVSLFVVAFPLAPLMALINNYLEIRLDAHKLIHLCQRPSPAGAATIGTWADILTIVSFIAVLVNTLMCTFYSHLIDQWTNGDAVYKAFVFIVVERIIMLLKFVISYAVDDIPANIQEHIDREEYLVSVLINGVAEDTEEVQRKKSVIRGYLSSFDFNNIDETFPADHPGSDPANWNKPVPVGKWFGQQPEAAEDAETEK